MFVPPLIPITIPASTKDGAVNCGAVPPAPPVTARYTYLSETDNVFATRFAPVPATLKSPRTVKLPFRVRFG